MAPRIHVVRVYGDERTRAGYRVLVDRLWPRATKKDELALDEWAKDVAPSHQLRKWYGHDPARFEEFSRRYEQELKSAPAADTVGRLRKLSARRILVLLTATKDVDRSGAAVLRQTLSGRRT